MKRLKALALCLLLSLPFVRTSAQAVVPLNEPDYNKPRIFSDLPQQMLLQVNAVNALFDLQEGQNASVQLTDKFSIAGVVVSNGSDKFSRTVIIRIPSRNNAIFTLTRMNGENGSATFTGRIMSRTNGDAFQIVKSNDQYYLNKIDLYDLISE